MIDQLGTTFYEYQELLRLGKKTLKNESSSNVKLNLVVGASFSWLTTRKTGIPLYQKLKTRRKDLLFVYSLYVIHYLLLLSIIIMIIIMHFCV